MSLNKWLYKFSNEISNTKVDINSHLQFNPSVPSELLDSVLNNLLSNALRKPEVSSVTILIKADQDLLFISVCDDGNRVSDASADDLFTKPVSSGQGMGIGLYQSALMAHAFDFELDLMTNEDGEVCFSLLQHFND
jgi:sensor histidine kinase regulating citrate/malate metabolism